MDYLTNLENKNAYFKNGIYVCILYDKHSYSGSKLIELGLLLHMSCKHALV